MTKILSAFGVLALLLVASPVMGQTASQTTIANAKARADQEITRRIASLNTLNTRIQGMKAVPAEDKAAMTNTVQTQISQLTALNAKIQADTDVATLKADIKAIATQYRVYLLIVPGWSIIAAADRIITTAPYYTSFGAVMQTAITQAQTNGNDVSALIAKLADYNAKVANAVTQANAANALLSDLVPDQGDDAMLASNNAAIKSAAAKLKLAIQDMQAARQLAVSMVGTLKGNATAKVTASYTVNGSTNITVNVGDTINYAWSSTNAVSAVHSYSQDSTSCGNAGTGPFDLGDSSTSGSVSEVVEQCWANHTYTLTFTAKGADGRTESAFATIKVNPLVN